MKKMKILLVCAGGMSTSILMQKMSKYWKENDMELDIKAVGLSEYQDVYQEYDVVMVGPQVSYRYYFFYIVFFDGCQLKPFHLLIMQWQIARIL